MVLRRKKRPTPSPTIASDIKVHEYHLIDLSVSSSYSFSPVPSSIFFVVPSVFVSSYLVVLVLVVELVSVVVFEAGSAVVLLSVVEFTTGLVVSLVAAGVESVFVVFEVVVESAVVLVTGVVVVVSVLVLVSVGVVVESVPALVLSVVVVFAVLSVVGVVLSPVGVLVVVPSVFAAV